VAQSVNFFGRAGREIKTAFLPEIMKFENITFIEFLLFFSNFIKLRNIRKRKFLLKIFILSTLDSAALGDRTTHPLFLTQLSPVFT
jgi:hypothetical protein